MLCSESHYERLRQREEDAADELDAAIDARADTLYDYRLNLIADGKVRVTDGEYQDVAYYLTIALGDNEDAVIRLLVQTELSRDEDDRKLACELVASILLQSIKSTVREQCDAAAKESLQ